MISFTDFKDDGQRWQAVTQRNRQADNKFVYAVKTTLIYCRPTCPSRIPNRKNVCFFENWQRAEQKGFRPCKRCNPQIGNGSNAKTEAVIQSCKMIEKTEEEPSLDEMADVFGLNSSHFHRLFKKIYYAVVPTSLGWALIAATEKGLCRIEFDDTPEALHDTIKTVFPEAELQENPPEFKTSIEKTVDFLEQPHMGLPLPLDIHGTAFQKRVWAELQKIPPGSTVNYGEIAKQIGDPNSARAVARACAANKIAVAIPCHRVVRSNGDLAGYRWGVSRKQTILKRESNESK